ncbi:disease resistance protein RGA3 [Canna indica]|uniref:Disease resistance protein RGA3 n=1 Tax=Canna indica TaxID=4628 RepID=A0AAQ3L3K7_9LILI|nr:disease resistance protein RGA3 [Canna indica]
MAILLQFFVPRYLGKLSNFIEDETFKVLCVKGEMRRLHRWLTRIGPYLQDAEQRMHHEDTIDTWVKELKGVMYDAEDIIDLCLYKGGELLEVHSSASNSVVCCPLNLILSCFECAKFRLEIAYRIRGLNARLKEIIEDNNVVSRLVHREQVPQDYTVKLPETSPAQVKEDIVGTQIKDAADKLIRMILDNDNERCSVFGIVGMGGIGKTTLAQKIYNDERIKNNFSNRQAWMYISRTYSDVKLLKQIVKDLGGNDNGAETIAPLETQLISLLSSTRKFFLVLDDVWTSNVWSNLLRKAFLNGEANCTILFTSRDLLMGGDMGANYVHPVEFIDEGSGWELLHKLVFGADRSIIPEGLEQIGKKIVQKCDRLPLAIKVMGGVLRKESTRRGWERVLESDIWRMNRIDDELPRALYLSYDVLPTHLKQCFLTCALYTRISNSTDLVRLWVAEGFIVEQGDGLMEETAEGYYKELVLRNLLQIDTTYATGNIFSMHDFLRSLGAKLMEDEGITISEGQSTNRNSLIKVRRLSLSNKEDTLTLPSVVIQQKCLRFLRLFNSPETKTIKDDVIKGLQHLRVLDICDTSIEVLPISIMKLLHLRYLDLDRTYIQELPESIGDLAYLQTLNISGCPSLHRLPNGITRLSNLRCLRAEDTPLTHVPRGIGKLTNLNHFDGFVVGQDDSPSSIVEGWNLEELQSFSNLRHLSIWRLDRASTTEGPAVLDNMTCLRHLHVCWTKEGDGAPLSKEQIQNAEKVFNDLNPPASIEDLEMHNFPGGQFPETIRSTSFPHLELLTLWYLPSCTQLPPLGQLPQLKYLSIKRAEAIKKIGPEFLGDWNSSRAPAFPKLDYLEFIDMPSWEEWVLWTEQEVRDERNHLKIFPNLTGFHLQDCSELRALPQAFSHSTNLKTFVLTSVDNLREIENLPFLTDGLYVINCKRLERISNHPSLKHLYVEDCSNLVYVGKLHALHHLVLRCPPTNEHLPQWLSNLLMKQQEGAHFDSQHSVKKFELQCGLPLLKSCLEGKANWPIIQQIPEVEIVTIDGNNFMLYTKDNKPQTNVVDSE